MKKATIILSLFIFIVCGFTIATADETFVIVPAWVTWKDAGIDFNQGDEVTIMAAGFWWGDPEGVFNEWHGPEGIPVCGGPDAPCPDCAAYSLIGKIGGEIFWIGARRTLQMPASGRLYLEVNDSYIPDNHGGFVVVIWPGTP